MADAGRSAPRLVEDYVRVTYWSCAVVGHQHATERSARRCIGLRPGERGAAGKLARNLRFIARVVAGDPIESIAAEGGCVPSNVAKAIAAELWEAHCASRAPYPWRKWTISRLRKAYGDEELAFLVRFLREKEAILRGMAP